MLRFRAGIGRVFFAVVAVLDLSCGSDDERSGKRREEASRAVELERTDLSVTGGLDAGVDPAGFRRAVKKAIGDSLAIPEPYAKGRLSVVGLLEPAAGREGQGEVVIEARLRADGLEAPVTAAVAAEGSASNPSQARELVKKTLRDLSRAVREMLSLLDGGPEDWIRGLDSPEPDLQILASRLLADERVKEAVPALGEMAADPRPHVAEAAAEALGRIGEESAVPLLIDSIRRGDLRSEVRAVEALARIGGDEAEAYLEMVAGGHQVEEVRRIARDALQRLRNRQSR
ncbi:MAG: HEAT repeat domain-containing protein [Polyangia bacterium]